MLSDEQLMLLEQLTYIHDKGGKVFSTAGNADPGVNCRTVNELLNGFDEAALAKLETGMTGDSTTGAEWAAIIRQIKQDPDLMDLELVRNTTCNEGIYCYADPKEAGRAYVCFAGTRDGDEWVDNVEGLDRADTAQQQKALEAIESLPYDHIAVAGHSKGGNKAMYVTVRSDKVDHCVSMDGQGFSQEFLDKYWAEIQLKGGKIKNVSLSNDFVNILMYPVPGSQQIYIDGGIHGANNHSPSKFFRYEKDGGNTHIKVDATGKPKLDVTVQTDSMKYLHDFTSFVIGNAPAGDKQRLISTLGVLLALARDSDYSFPMNGKVYTQANLMEYIMDNKQDIGLALAYLAKYVEIYGLSEEQIEDLLRQFGLGDLVDKVHRLMEEGDLKALAAMAAGEGLLKFLFKQLTDGKRDPIIEKLLGILDDHLGDFGISLRAIWNAADYEYNNLNPSVGKTPVSNGNIRTGRIFDRRMETFDVVREVITNLNNAAEASVAGWSGYNSEDWFSRLLVSTAVRGIGMYVNNVREINQNCLIQLYRIFEDSWDLDDQKAIELSNQVQTVSQINTNINTIISSIG